MLRSKYKLALIKRDAQELMPAKSQQHKDAAEPAVAVLKRMNRFELVMQQCDLNKHGQRVAAAHVCFEIVHQVVQQMRRRRNKAGPGNSFVFFSDVHLLASEAACAFVTSRPVKQDAVHLTQEVVGYGISVFENSIDAHFDGMLGIERFATSSFASPRFCSS